MSIISDFRNHSLSLVLDNEVKSNLNEELNSDFKSLRKKYKCLAYIFLLISLLIILELIFPEPIYSWEVPIIEKLQKFFDLNTLKSNNNLFVGLLHFINADIMPSIILFIFTVTYYLIHANITVHVAVVTYFIAFIFVSLTILYSEPAPYWYSSEILSTACTRSYASPDVSSVYMIFISYYWYSLWQKNQKEEATLFKRKREKCFFVFCIVVSILVMVFMSGLKYLDGEMFLSQIFVTFFYLGIAIAFTSLFSKQIKSFMGLCIVHPNKGNMFVFYTILYVAIAEFCVFVYISLLEEEGSLSVSAKFTDNFLNCVINIKNPTKFDTSTHTIGLWSTFKYTQCIFLHLGTAIGSAYAFSGFQGDVNWDQQRIPARLIGLFLGLLFNIPSSLLNNLGGHYFSLSKFTLQAFVNVTECWLIFGGIPRLLLHFGIYRLKNKKKKSIGSLSRGISSSIQDPPPKRIYSVQPVNPLLKDKGGLEDDL